MFLTTDPSKIEDVIDDTIGTLILEPIQGETGIIVPPDGLIQHVREICNRHNLVLIFDEIQAGLGRTGKMWAGQNWSTTPDIMCLAKGIAGGIPMGVTLAKPEIIEAMSSRRTLFYICRESACMCSRYCYS